MELLWKGKKSPDSSEVIKQRLGLGKDNAGPVHINSTLSPVGHLRRTFSLQPLCHPGTALGPSKEDKILRLWVLVVHMMKN